MSDQGLGLGSCSFLQSDRKQTECREGSWLLLKPQHLALFLAHGTWPINQCAEEIKDPANEMPCLAAQIREASPSKECHTNLLVILNVFSIYS